MTKPIWEWPESYGNTALQVVKGLVSFPIYAIMFTPIIFYLLVTGRVRLAWVEIENMAYRTWPQWFDEPDTTYLWNYDTN